ncbi:MAG: AhpC/TSA family protein [Planctomycetes bacterium]|nr:AhpC/TSA family protein [Planctomycetota bacterium]
MRRRETDLAALGARLVFVGTGTPAMAADFARTHAGPHPVLSDPARRTFAAAGMRRSLWATLHWRLLPNLLRALRAGFRQTGVQGDAWQQGGVVVFDAEGRMRHREVDHAGGDELDLDAVVAAARYPAGHGAGRAGPRR